jgi:hypothetical protein
MKKFVLLVIAFVGFACVHTQPMEDADVVEVKPHPLTAIWVDYAKSNPHIFNNQMSRDKAAPEVNKMLMDTLSCNPQLLIDCPVRYEQMIKLSKNKYAIKFSLMRFNPQNITYYENYTEYDVSTDIFAIVDENFALKLKDRQMYALKGFTFEGDVNEKNITLPSGAKVCRKPGISITSTVDNDRNFSLSGIFLSDLKLAEI